MDEFTGFGMSYQLYNALIELKADGTMEPSLATSWEYEMMERYSFPFA